MVTRSGLSVGSYGVEEKSRAYPAPGSLRQSVQILCETNKGSRGHAQIGTVLKDVRAQPGRTDCCEACTCAAERR
jgi:hypothetical protein